MVGLITVWHNLCLKSFDVLTGKRKINFELREGKGPCEIHKGSGLQEILDSDMAKELYSLREALAQKHGEVFPYSVLSTQQIAQLCVQKPTSLTQVRFFSSFNIVFKLKCCLIVSGNNHLQSDDV